MASKKRVRKVVEERVPQYHDFESLSFRLESPFENEPGDDPELLEDDAWPLNGETKSVQPVSARKHVAVGCVLSLFVFVVFFSLLRACLFLCICEATLSISALTVTVGAFGSAQSLNGSWTESTTFSRYRAHLFCVSRTPLSTTNPLLSNEHYKMPVFKLSNLFFVFVLFCLFVFCLFF